jgi:hypothetical protein
MNASLWQHRRLQDIFDVASRTVVQVGALQRRFQNHGAAARMTMQSDMIGVNQMFKHEIQYGRVMGDGAHGIGQGSIPFGLLGARLGRHGGDVVIGVVEIDAFGVGIVV